MGTPTFVTGIGVAAPNGLGVERYWRATLEGRSGIGRLTRFDPSGYPATLAGEIRDFDPARHVPSRLLAQTDWSTKLALYAADAALADAKVEPAALPEYEMGVVTSNACGGFAFTHQEFQKLWSQGPEHVSVYESFAWFYAVNSGQISIRHGMRGQSRVLVAEQAGGLDAIGEARRGTRAETGLVVTGGVDSALDPWGWVSQLSDGLVSPATDPAAGYRPFDRAADGYLPGEGGAVLVLERADFAERRQAPQRYGTIAGYASTFDPPPGSPRPPALRRAAELAIADAGLEPGDIDAVFADGAGVPELDRAEAEAISCLFGPCAVPVTVPKALTGRLYAGGGPLDVVTALLSIRDGVLPATANTTRLDPDAGIDLVLGGPRLARVTSALVLARGRHGFNAAVVVTAADR